jgi:hypothetical protein
VPGTLAFKIHEQKGGLTRKYRDIKNFKITKGIATLY